MTSSTHGHAWLRELYRQDQYRDVGFRRCLFQHAKLAANIKSPILSLRTTSSLRAMILGPVNSSLYTQEIVRIV